MTISISRLIPVITVNLLLLLYHLKSAFVWIMANDEESTKTPDPKQNMEYASSISNNPNLGNVNSGEEAFRNYYHKYRPIFFHFTCKLVGDKEIAKDIVSDAYAICWEKRAQFGTMQEIHAYMYVTCRNRAYNFLKYGTGFKNKKEISITSSGDIGEVINEETVLQDIIRNEHFLELYSQIDRLPPQRRQVVQLHFIEGYSLKEVAQMMNIPYPLVKSVKSQALAQLRSFMSPRKS